MIAKQVFDLLIFALMEAGTAYIIWNLLDELNDRFHIFNDGGEVGE